MGDAWVSVMTVMFVVSLRAVVAVMSMVGQMVDIFLVSITA
jgi:hypothetical protein